MFHKTRTIACLISVMWIAGCSNDHAVSQKKQVMTVREESIPTVLYYAGTILPLQSVVVTSPADGVVTDVNFHYGEAVKAGDILFSIASEKFISDYKNALMQYIKAKRDLSLKKNQIMESQFLYRNQLISQDELKGKQGDYYDAELAFLQAKEALTGLLKRIDLKDNHLYDLKIDQIDKITKVLQLQNDSARLIVTTPMNGIGLLPNATDNGSEVAKRFGKGDMVKQGDVLALIGDLNGLRVRIEVNEFNVNQLKIGDKVKVTGAAFPQFVLEGKIASVDRQADTSQGGSPLFAVEIKVPQLTALQKATIHVGMSAKVEIDIASPQKIVLPIQAVYEKEGESRVRLEDASGKLIERPVKTGPTTVAGVIIENGLSPGDRVIVN